MKYKIYTDGACKKNGKKGAMGGWAYAIFDEEGTLLLAHTGHEDGTTNQRMEITAILEACKMVATLNENESLYSCEINSDSAYCINCYKEQWYSRWESNGWKTASREPVKNKELWQELTPFFKDCRFSFNKVRGHSDCAENNLVDELAQRAAISDDNIDDIFEAMLFDKFLEENRI